MRQVCTGVSVAFDDQAVADFFDRQVDLGRRPEQFGRIWVHTHPGNSPEPSMTDEDTFARVFGRTDWAVMFILARRARAMPGCGSTSAPAAIWICRSAWITAAPSPPATMPHGKQEYLANVRGRRAATLRRPSAASARRGRRARALGRQTGSWPGTACSRKRSRGLPKERRPSHASEPNRFQRQEDLVPRDRLADIKATVIGVGAIGRQVGLATGCHRRAAAANRRLRRGGPDERHHPGLSGRDVGQPKVQATAAAIRQLDPAIPVETIQDRYRPRMEIGQAVFCCVDSIEARSAIWRSARLHGAASGRTGGCWAR